MSSTNPRLRADAVRNRERTLDAVRALLADPDVAITVEAIAAKAGVSPATVVRVFGNKEALIDAAVSGLLAPLVQRARDLLSSTVAEEALPVFLVELIAFQAAHHGMNAQLDSLNLPATETERAGLRQVVVDMVTAARNTGMIRTDLAEDVTLTLIAECTYAVARSPANSPELAESYVQVLMDGLRPQPPHG